MGLLSDPDVGSAKWVRVLKRVHSPVCFLCYVGALVWFVLLGHREFNNETYFSENALLPGLVTNEFNAEKSASQYYNELLLELETKYEEMDVMPVSWLVGMMSHIHLEVYTHNFTLHYPLGRGQVFRGTNVYGILRAPRTSSLEALVVSVPYRNVGSHQKTTAAGIALMLAFAKFARPQKYWAKDIIFLVTQHDQLGMQAWLEAYHGLHNENEPFHASLGSFWKPGTPAFNMESFFPNIPLRRNHKKALNPGTLKGRSGSIQAAILLEFNSPQIRYVEVKIEGLNGQLPNLDLVNLVHKLCQKSGIHHSFAKSYSWIRGRDSMDEWKSGFWTMFEMVLGQIDGVPDGNHGLFHRFGIEAVTLEGRDELDPGGKVPRVNTLSLCNFYKLGIALESILRSLNNLLERFHQSYFFYILASTHRFISIGQYMPSLCLLCVAMLIRALSLWVTTLQQDGDYNDKQTKKVTPKSSKHKLEKAKDSDSEEPGEQETQEVRKVKTPEKKKAKINMSVLNIGVNYLLVHLIGYGVMNTPFILSYYGSLYYNKPPEVSVYFGIISIAVLLIFITPFLPYMLRKGPITYEELSLVNILVLTELSTVCLSVAMQNFSLGFAIAVIYTPLALMTSVYVKGSGKARACVQLVKRLCCVCLHPLVVVVACMVAYSRRLVADDSWLATLGRGSDAAMQAIMFSVADSMLYGNWLFNLTTSVILPIWLIFWQILNIKVDAP